MIIWFMNSREVIPSMTSDWWPVYVCEFSVTGWTPSSRTFILLTKPDAVTPTNTHGTFFVIHPSSFSFATWSTDTHHLFVRPAEDFHIQTAAKTLNCDWRHFESTPRNYITLWTITVNHLQYCYCDNPLRYVTTHLSQRTLQHFIHCRELVFFSSQIPTPRVYSTTTIPYRNCY